MDSRPHTHQPKVYYCTIFQEWKLEYGDTSVRVCLSWRKPTEKDVKRALAKAVRQHDDGSRKAAEDERKRIEVNLLALHTINQIPAGSWASEHLKETR